MGQVENWGRGWEGIHGFLNRSEDLGILRDVCAGLLKEMGWGGGDGGPQRCQGLRHCYGLRASA